MNNIREFLTNLSNRGIKISLSGVNIKCNAPKAVLTDEIKEQIFLNKNKIIEFLKQIELIAETPLSSINKKTRKDQYIPLSYSQEQVWYIQNLALDEIVYSEPCTIFFHENIDKEKLQLSLNLMIKRHAGFRTTFHHSEAGSHQIIHDNLTFHLKEIDLQEVRPAQVEFEYKARASELLSKPFDLTKLPLVRGFIARISKTDNRLFLVIHHIIIDGNSLYSVFLPELEQIYRSLQNNRIPVMPQLSYDYADFAYWQRQLFQTKDRDASLFYWRNKLSPLPYELTLSTSNRIRDKITFYGRKELIEIPKQLSGKIKNFCRQEHITVFMLLQTALKIFLHYYTNQDDITIGTVISQRTQNEMLGIIGNFVNNLVLKSTISDDPVIRDLLQDEKRNILDAFKYHELPFAVLIQELQPPRHINRNPIFQIVLVLQPSIQNNSGWILDHLSIHTDRAKFDLLIDLTESSEQITGYIEYRTDLFDTTFISHFTNCLQQILQGIIEFPQNRISQLPAYLVNGFLEKSSTDLGLIIPNARLKRKNFNKTGWRKKKKLLHELFSEQAKLKPEKLAVICSRGNKTYGSLELISNKLAQPLREHGACPNKLIAIIMEKGWEQIVACLGILKAGAAYLPIDPTLPATRIEYLLRCGEVEQLITQKEYLDQLTKISYVKTLSTKSIHVIDERNQFLDSYPDIELAAVQSLEDLAYVIFTSGTTGIPKGVMIEHGAVVNTILDINDRFKISSKDSILSLSNLNFDLSVYDIFGLLAVGGTIILPSQQSIKEPEHWCNLIERNKITIWNTVPMFMQMLIEYLQNSKKKYFNRPLRLVLLSGDWIPLDLPRKIRKEFNKSLLVSLGGATEASIWSIAYPIKSINKNWSSIPYGNPLRNQTIYVLNKYFQQCPDGVKGEIFIGGAGIARGYWKDAEKTAKQFIKHPITGEILYRTGDLGLYKSQGYIEFLGREDNQIKINGYRIEIGEIEHALLKHPRIKDAIVTASGDKINKSLIAYYVSEQKIPIRELREFLETAIADYMIPNYFIHIKNLPLTSNGKLDYGKLPEIDVEDTDEFVINFIAPRSPIEKKLSDIWCQLLKQKRISIRDNFFNLGGHSLLAVSLMLQIEKHFNKKLSLATLFKAPTVEKLAQILT